MLYISDFNSDCSCQSDFIHFSQSLKYNLIRNVKEDQSIIFFLEFKLWGLNFLEFKGPMEGNRQKLVSVAGSSERQIHVFSNHIGPGIKTVFCLFVEPYHLPLRDLNKCLEVHKMIEHIEVS